jgi:hypothetical protein
VFKSLTFSTLVCVLHWLLTSREHGRSHKSSLPSEIAISPLWQAPRDLHHLGGLSAELPTLAALPTHQRTAQRTGNSTTHKVSVQGLNVQKA